MALPRSVPIAHASGCSLPGVIEIEEIRVDLDPARREP